MRAAVVQWSNGPMVQWSNGPMVQWSNGPMVQWSNGPIVCMYSLFVYVIADRIQLITNMIIQII